MCHWPSEKCPLIHRALILILQSGAVCGDNLIACKDLVKKRDLDFVAKTARCGSGVVLGEDPTLGDGVRIVGGTFGDAFEAKAFAEIGNRVQADDHVVVGAGACIPSRTHLTANEKVPGRAKIDTVADEYVYPRAGYRFKLLANGSCAEVEMQVYTILVQKCFNIIESS